MTQYATPPRFGTQPVEQASLLTLLEVTGTCRTCGASFTTTDPDRRLCDAHLVECINGAGILEDDDEDEIDWDRPRRTPPPTARITCAACGLAATIPVAAAGRLCGLCREDLDATEARIRANVEAINATWQFALVAWDADYAQASEFDQQRYQNVVEARGKVHDGLIKEASYMARYREALERNDGLAALLQAETRRDMASEQAGKLLAECERGLAEVEAVRG